MGDMDTNEPEGMEQEPHDDTADGRLGTTVDAAREAEAELANKDADIYEAVETFAKAPPPLPSIPPMPEPSIPEPEPAQPLESWRDVTPGTAAFPVKLLDGTWAAGGNVVDTLCVSPDGLPRCHFASSDGRCSGPPTEDQRRGRGGFKPMTSCVAFLDRTVGR